MSRPGSAHCDLAPIHQRLDRIEKKLDEVAVTLTRQVAVCRPARAQLDAVCQSVYGNGRDGLACRVARLETVRRVWGELAAAAIGLISGAGMTVLAWMLGK